VQRLSAVPAADRLELFTVTPCRPLRDAREAVGYAIARFHESWSRYRTVTPTLYLVGDDAPGLFVTLGRLRKRYGLSWDTTQAVVEAFEGQREVRGFIVAASGVGGDPLTPLFTLQGHDLGERHHGALDLTLLTPFEQGFATELELEAGVWQERWAEAAATAKLPG
jgi:hypothetical protein